MTKDELILALRMLGLCALKSQWAPRTAEFANDVGVMTAVFDHKESTDNDADKFKAMTELVAYATSCGLQSSFIDLVTLTALVDKHLSAFQLFAQFVRPSDKENIDSCWPKGHFMRLHTSTLSGRQLPLVEVTDIVERDYRQYCQLALSHRENPEVLIAALTSMGGSRKSPLAFPERRSVLLSAPAAAVVDPRVLVLIAQNDPGFVSHMTAEQLTLANAMILCRSNGEVYGVLSSCQNEETAYCPTLSDIMAAVANPVPMLKRARALPSHIVSLYNSLDLVSVALQNGASPLVLRKSSEEVQAQYKQSQL
jgi:hypothetical protein